MFSKIMISFLEHKIGSKNFQIGFMNVTIESKRAKIDKRRIRFNSGGTHNLKCKVSFNFWMN